MIATDAATPMIRTVRVHIARSRCRRGAGGLHELEADVRRTLLTFLYSASGSALRDLDRPDQRDGERRTAQVVGLRAGTVPLVRPCRDGFPEEREPGGRGTGGDRDLFATDVSPCEPVTSDRLQWLREAEAPALAPSEPFSRKGKWYGRWARGSPADLLAGPSSRRGTIGCPASPPVTLSYRRLPCVYSPLYSVP